jgi:hypothetical protein
VATTGLSTQHHSLHIRAEVCLERPRLTVRPGSQSLQLLDPDRVAENSCQSFGEA